MDRLFLITALAFSAILATACNGNSQDQTHTPSVNIEAQFLPVVDAFVAESKNQGANVTISDLTIQSVPELSGGQLGVCQTDPTGATSPTILISQAVWDVLDADSQEELLFHELGHCVLNRAHNNELSGGIPVSMMDGVFLGSGLYVANKRQYMHELFHKSDLPEAFPLRIPQNTLIPDFSAAPNT